MNEQGVAKRYSRAIFELAMDESKIDEIGNDMKLVRAAVKQVPLFVKGLSDARVEEAKRIAAAGDILKVLGVGKLATNVIILLIRKNRMGLADAIALNVELKVEHHLKLAVASATVASASLVDEVKRRVEEIMTRELGCKARCDVDVDRDLIGGLAVSIGDRRYDASIRGKMERMKEELL